MHTGIVLGQTVLLFLAVLTITITTTEIMVNVVLSEILVLLAILLVSMTLEAIATGIVQGQMELQYLAAHTITTIMLVNVVSDTVGSTMVAQAVTQNQITLLI